MEEEDVLHSVRWPRILDHKGWPRTGWKIVVVVVVVVVVANQPRKPADGTLQGSISGLGQSGKAMTAPRHLATPEALYLEVPPRI